MPGFGQTPGARHGAQPLFRSGELPALSPSSLWRGTAASGFSVTPVDPVRTTAKPACRLLVPPGQRFTNTVTIGVAAFANDGGTLIGGIDRVRFHYEGSTLDVVAPSYHSFKDANDRTVAYFGYWARLKRQYGPVGEALLYIEAIPADATMQSRVIGPYSFYPHEKLHDREYTINPDAAVTATNLHTFDAAISRIKSDAAKNPRITFKKAMGNVESNFSNLAYSAQSYVTVEADFPVTFGRTAMATNADVDTAARMRPRVGAMWFKGENITFDYAFMDTALAETGENWVLDGINMTNSRGFGALWRGGPYWTFARVTGSPWFLECTISNLENACTFANLVRGGVVRNATRDIFSDGRCIVGTRVERHSDTIWNNDTPVMSVVYTGAEATATVSRIGSPDPGTATYAFKWGANSRTFTCGKGPAFYAAGLSGDSGYTFGHLVTWINTVLAGLDSGWSATLIDTDGWRATSGSLPGRKAQGFGDTNCKDTAQTIVSAFDTHGDWYQQRFDGIRENVIAYGNIGFDMQTQNIFLSSNVPAQDFVFVNNAFANDPVGSDYFIPGVFLSQIGRANNATVMSHVVLAHNSMPNQGLGMRNDGTTSYSTHDAYCLIANNVLRTLSRSSKTPGREIGATIRNNHIHEGQGPLPEAVGTTIGGDADSLFENFAIGDFTPKGALLTNLKAPVVSFDPVSLNQGANAAAGVIQPSIPA